MEEDDEIVKKGGMKEANGNCIGRAAHLCLVPLKPARVAWPHYNFN